MAAIAKSMYTAAETNLVLDAAIDYANRGLPVFPCNPSTKQPYTAKGFKDATTDLNQICDWWTRHPTAMIGLPTGTVSGFWALDIDVKPDANGAAELAKLEAANGDLPATPIASTPSGGKHYYFKHQDGVKNRGGLEPGIDVRGEGGYVIAPGSVKDDGTYYAWQYESELATAPAWLLALVIKAPLTTPPIKASGSNTVYSEAAINSELQKLIGSFSNRNNQLNDSAFAIGQFVGAGEISYSDAAARLFGAATANGYVGKDGGTSASATIKSGLDAGQREPRKIPDPSVRLVAANDNVAGGTPAATPIEIFWHGNQYDRVARPWLVKELIPETGHGLASGQWGACKTFGMIDLSGSVMTGTPFAGREVCRRGGILFIAAEGANEIPIRLQGVVDHKLRLNGQEGAADLENLPFAWIEECPSIKEDANFNRIVAIATTVVGNMKEQFDLPLALIIVDTLSAAADIDDANASAENQRIMNRFGVLSRRTGAVVLAVDHFGKAVETGTRGSSAKEASADFVLAFLADRDVNGTISNTRMAVRKLRGGATGAETPFNLKVVDIGDGETTGIIEWQADREPQSKTKGTKESKATRMFRVSMNNAMATTGKTMWPFGSDGVGVRAVALSQVRDEFVAAWPANGETAEKIQDAKRSAFNRALNNARVQEICSREIGGIDCLWFVTEPEQPATATD